MVEHNPRPAGMTPLSWAAQLSHFTVRHNVILVILNAFLLELVNHFVCEERRERARDLVEVVAKALFLAVTGQEFEAELYHPFTHAYANLVRIVDSPAFTSAVGIPLHVQISITGTSSGHWTMYWNAYSQSERACSNDSVLETMVGAAEAGGLKSITKTVGLRSPPVAIQVKYPDLRQPSSPAQGPPDLVIEGWTALTSDVVERIAKTVIIQTLFAEPQVGTSPGA